MEQMRINLFGRRYIIGFFTRVQDAVHFIPRDVLLKKANRVCNALCGENVTCYACSARPRSVSVVYCLGYIQDSVESARIQLRNYVHKVTRFLHITVKSHIRCVRSNVSGVDKCTSHNYSQACSSFDLGQVACGVHAFFRRKTSKGTLNAGGIEDNTFAAPLC